MDIRQLRLFLTVADTGSFYSAAEKLFISRPAVSKSIAQIEEEFGLPLFERGVAGVTLTPAGEELFPRAQRIVWDFDELEGFMRDLCTGKQTIRIGFCFGTYVVFMDRLQDFAERNPQFNIEIAHYQYEDAVAAVKTGRVDFICSGYAFNDEDLARQNSCRCEALWGVPSDSEAARRGYITDDEIHSYPHCIPSGSRSMKSDISLSAISDRRGDAVGETDLSYQYILNDNMFLLCKLVLQGKAIMPIGREALPVGVEGISFLVCPEHAYYWEADIYYPRTKPLRKCVKQLIDEVFTQN